jgi:nucleoside 2-deoxyribosyltransferase
VATGQSIAFICGRCGLFKVTEEFLWALPERPHPKSDLLYRISHAFRIEAELTTTATDLPVHFAAEVDQLLSALDPPVQEKLDSLLGWMARVCVRPGRTAEFDYTNDYTVICAHDSEEASFLVDTLAQQALISLGEPTLDSTTAEFVISAHGWSRLHELKQSGSESDTAFVAMWFDEARSPFDKAIGDAITAAGYRALRMDRVEHVNRIDDEIISRLRSAKFLVADFTGQRAGTYFEAGFMLGLGRPVIWLCQKDEIAHLHFDTRQYNTIDYSDPVDLEKRLAFRIKAVIGPGPKALPE